MDDGCRRGAAPSCSDRGPEPERFAPGGGSAARTDEKCRPRGTGTLWMVSCWLDYIPAESSSREIMAILRVLSEDIPPLRTMALSMISVTGILESCASRVLAKS